jgi:hypothetical protein
MKIDAGSPTARVSERLWQRLHAMGLAESCGVGLRSLRPSRASRAAGAWSWAAVDADGIPLPLGSQTPIGELLAAKRLMASLYTGDHTGDITVGEARNNFPDHVRPGEWSWTELGQILLEELEGES